MPLLPHNASASLRGSLSRVWPASTSTLGNQLNTPRSSLPPSFSAHSLGKAVALEVAFIVVAIKSTTMGIKRKHFDEASPTSVCSPGFVSSPDAQWPAHFPQGLDGTADTDMDLEPTPRSGGWDFSRAHRTKSSDWGLRTRKRVRDNRPDERAIQGTQLSPTAPSPHTYHPTPLTQIQRTQCTNSSSRNATHTPPSHPPNQPPTPLSP